MGGAMPMIYSMEEIRSRVSAVAERHGLKAVYLFGSYARGTATADSDIDLLIDISGTKKESSMKLQIVSSGALSKECVIWWHMIMAA